MSKDLPPFYTFNEEEPPPYESEEESEEAEDSDLPAKLEMLPADLRQKGIIPPLAAQPDIYLESVELISI